MRALTLLGRLSLSSAALLALATGCAVNLGKGNPSPSSEGDESLDTTAIAGANANDRSMVKDGESIATGSMIVSPSGKYIVMQRNSVTLIHDVAQRSYLEAAFYAQRVGFSPNSEIAYVTHSLNGSPSISAIDLASGAALWSRSLPEPASSLRVSPSGASIALSDARGAFFVSAQRGEISGRFPVASAVSFSAWIPNSNRALFVAQTRWPDGKPHTPVYVADGTSGLAKTLDVPNCESPIVVTPDGKRAFLSPTYCVPGAQAVPGQVWTNPDPVSVIDLDASGAQFVKNLPGFGPVVMDNEGSRVVAYLDTQRMDAAMFDDPRQVPSKDFDRYHLMTIDPKTLKFSLAPIGNAIPRFAMTRDGRGLLVDASYKVSSRSKLAVKAQGSIGVGIDGITGGASVDQNVFGSGRAFGYFNLISQKFEGFDGPAMSLDRFVQLADGRTVLALAARADGLGGDPFVINLSSKTVTKLGCNYEKGVRDVGVSSDGRTAYLRLRLAANHKDKAFYSREGLSVTADGSCAVGLEAEYEASVPFSFDPPPPPPPPPYTPPPPPPPVPECREQHDC
jgi:hypothetical protein